MTVAEYEKKGRDKLKEDFSNAECEVMYEFTDGEYDSIDCFATACTGVKYAIEIKNRDISINKYDDVILEVHKYNALMTAYIESGYTPVYMVYYRDGRLSWDLSRLDLENRVEERACAESTFNYEHKINKKIILLKKEECCDKKRSSRKNI